MILKKLKEIDIILLILFISSCLLKFVINNYNFSPYIVADPDLYIQSFKKFSSESLIKSLATGTSFLYNLFILFFSKIVKNEFLSFFLVNVLSQFFLLFYGFSIIKRYSKELDFKSKIIVFSFYLLSILELNSFNYTFNDTFQAVIFIVIFNVVFKAYSKKIKMNIKQIVLISILSALCTLIRPTSLIFIVVILFVIFFYNILFSFGTKVLFSNLFIYLTTTTLVIIILHGLSIYNNGKLSFYDKNFDSEVNWTQRNFLAIKLMDEGEIPVSKNSIFREVKFEKVKNYLQINGEDSLPKNQKEFIQKDVLLYFKLIVFNVFYSSLKFFRYYGFLFFIPFLFLISCLKKVNSSNLFFSLVIFSVVIVLSASCFTIVEYRWYTGYSILIAMMLIDFFKNNKLNSFWQLLINLSLILVAIFNFYFTFSPKDY